jgi:hypothetical protein
MDQALLKPEQEDRRPSGAVACAVLLAVVFAVVAVIVIIEFSG